MSKSNNAVEGKKLPRKRNKCRICLASNVSLVNIFNPYKNSTAAHYINLITDIKIQKDDKLPRTICKGCVKELGKVLKFKEKCEKSDKYLRNLVEEDIKCKLIKCESLGKESIKDENIKKPMEFVNRSSPTVEKESVENPLVKEETQELLPEYHDGEQDNSADEDLAEPANKPTREFALTGLDCIECGKTFKNELKRKIHWYNVHKKKSYKCEKCQKVYKSLEKYEKHINLEVSCELRFKGMRIEVMGKNKIYHCTSCEYKCNTFSGLKNHLVRHTGDRPYACNLCPKTYTCRKTLSYHKETIHKVNNVSITCHICGKIVEGKDRFSRHFRFTHPNNQYQCDICKVFRKSRHGLINHIKLHENLREYICDICGEKYNISSHLRNHIRRAHENHTMDCHLCGYKTKKKNYLQKHIEQHHQEKLQCSVCYRFMDTPQKLIKHMKVHGDKKHFCVYCNKGFALKNYCSTHVKLAHGTRFPLDYNKKYLAMSSVEQKMKVAQ